MSRLFLRRALWVGLLSLGKASAQDPPDITVLAVPAALLLGFEALANTLAVSAVTQLIAGRERPLEGAGHGRFWFNNALSSSFPSMHSSMTWSMASVLAHAYSHPWVQFLANGTATTVSITCVTGLSHFPADVAVGRVFGNLIGQHIFRAHSRSFRSHHEKWGP